MNDTYLGVLLLLVLAYAIWSTWWNQRLCRGLYSAADDIDRLTKECDELAKQLAELKK